MKIALVTDAWTPQVNGVVRTLTTTVRYLEQAGHTVLTIAPNQFRSIPCPTYPEIRLALAGRRKVGALLEAFAPDAVHIATEGPLGIAARGHCVAKGRKFTTAYHTRFPEYVAERTPLTPAMVWPYIRWFHKPASAIFVATRRLAAELSEQRLTQTRLWGRGVDLSLFRPNLPVLDAMASLPRPIQLYVGRVAVEKNIETFLSTKEPGTKVVVGDGPALARLKADFADVQFLGTLHGEALASAYASADVFVFPSLTDTFGLVVIEALAAGTPVAAFPVAGPLDILGDDGRGIGGKATARIGALNADLSQAIRDALTADREACAAYAKSFSWEASVAQFLDNLVPSPAALDCVTVKTSRL
jgi:glycosyltransferase involved in cell wall biosynthesis